MSETEAYQGWALSSKNGLPPHGWKSAPEVEQFGTKMLQLYVPFFANGSAEPAGFATRFAGGPSLYQVSPLEEKAGAPYGAQSERSPAYPANGIQDRGSA